MVIKEGLLLINGEWKKSSQALSQEVNAIEDKEILGTVELCSKKDIDEALQYAKKAQKEWSKIPSIVRADYLKACAQSLRKQADTLAKLLCHEIAKPLKDAKSEIIRTAEIIEYTSYEGLHMNNELLRDGDFFGGTNSKYGLKVKIPLGIILAISPFNYPVNLLASKVAPALMTGNTVLCKPAHVGILSALELCKIFNDVAEEMNLPKGIISCITGKSSEIGDYLINHEGINMIAFTGSTQVGEHIAQQVRMIPLQLELGGKDPAIVCKDADINLAGKQIVKGAFSYNGQRCTAIKRVIVDEIIADELIDIIKKEVEKLIVGNAIDNAQITPVISNASAKYIEELYKDAMTKGAKEINPFYKNDLLISPTILDHVTKEMRIYTEEQFGPILPIIRVKSCKDAIEIANDSEYGLQASIFTKSNSTFFTIAESIEAGTINLNAKTARGPDNFPFLGVKKSGLGTQGIKYSLNAMTKDKLYVLNK